MATSDLASRLPVVATYRVRLTARAKQTLPPLPTTALHGAFGRALKRLVCTEPQRTPCEGCPHLARCSYPMLYEPPASSHDGALAGLTTRAPSPIVFAPEEPTRDGRPFELEEGASIVIRLTLIGSRAVESFSLVIAALRAAVAAGIDRRDVDGTRKGMEVSDVALDCDEAPMPTSRCRIEFLTPLRLKDGGKVRGNIDGPMLLRALERRADILVRLYGAGLPDTEEASGSADAVALRLSDVQTRVVHVRRYSSRQRATMTWPGVLGHAVIEGDLERLGTLLAFGQRVQIGKATSFGFGRYLVRPCEPS